MNHAAKRGVSALFVGTVAGNGVRFVFGVILARKLGVSSFGVYSLMTVLMLSIYTLGSIGCSDAAVRFIARAASQRNRRDLVRTILVLGTIVIVTGIASMVAVRGKADSIAFVWFDKPEIATWLRLLAWSLPAGSLFMLSTGVVQGFQAFRLLTLLRNGAFPCLPLLTWLVLDGPHRGLETAFSSWVIALWLTAGIGIGCSWWLYRVHEWRSAPPTTTASLFARFILPVSVLGAVNSAQSWLDSLLVGRFASTAAVGLYGAANRLVQPLSFLTLAFTTVYAPGAATAFAENDAKKLLDLNRTFSRWLLLAGSVPFVAFIAAGPVALLLFGRDFLEGYLFLAILATGQFVSMMAGPSAQYLLMTRYPSRMLVATISGLLFCAAAAVVLIPRHGALGAAITFLIGQFALSATLVVNVRQTSGAWPWDWRTILNVLATLVVAAAAFAIQWTMLPRYGAWSSSLLATAVAGAGAMWLVRSGLSPNERRALARRALGWFRWSDS